MELWIWIGAASVTIGGIIIYVAIMIFFPEWVGITGKTALDTQRSHRSGEVEKDEEFLVRLQGNGQLESNASSESDKG